ncbi:hypothetical protein PITC_083040 [Penicillium italicum]|uniref:Uncharacterized protein n=1 Tax=Penicillium italicum TaxID=40296 RepID=A0A0A2LDK2_PENIT|nr:hypothetical protein PITC_083040 [Penicillium italicum]
MLCVVAYEEQATPSWPVRVVGDGVWSWRGNSAADGGGEEVGSDRCDSDESLRK